MMPPLPQITAAICTRDRATLLAECLPSVLACDYRPHEVLVVDQSGDDQTRDLVRRLQADHDDLVYVPTTTRGLSASRNVAAAQARGEIIAFTDDDCLAAVDWLRALAEEFAAAPEIAAICGRSLPLVESPLVGQAASVRTDEVRRRFRGPCSPWRVGNGSNMAFRTAVLRAVGPFDERLGPGAPFRGGEEADLLYRLLRDGHQILYSPRPLVYHRQWRSPAQQLALAHDYGVGVGAFCGKYLRQGDVRAARTLGGWTVATLTDLARALRAREAGRAQAAERALAGLFSGTLGMALAGPGRSRG